jgi:tRNA(Ile)-lysidine synthase
MTAPESQPSFRVKLCAAWPTERWRDVTVLVAVSGGADSVALARGLTAFASGPGRVVLAHFNHRLRGAESDADEAFVRDLAAELQIEVISGRAEADLAAGGSGEGLEGAARQARYDFLAKAAAKCGARYIATAHTADDNVETVLFNVLRGTGLAGLAGIPRLRPINEFVTIVRPLLEVTRAEVLDYLRSVGQIYREDATNRAVDYTRNRIRLQLLPLLERDYNPRVRQSLLRLAEIATQTDDLLNHQAEALFTTAARQIAKGLEFNLEKTRNTHPAMLRHACLLAWQQQGWPLQDMSHDKWQQLVQLLRAMALNDSAHHIEILPGGIRLERDPSVLRLTR